MAWQPIPVFLSGESLWTEEPGGLQLDMTEVTTHTSFVWRHILSLSILDDSIIIKEYYLINLIAPCVVQASNVC